MKFLKRYLNFFILFVLLIGLIGLFFVSFLVDQKVVFTDSILEASIREVLDQPQKPLHVSEVSRITKLDLSNKGISSLDGIESLSNLTILNLENNNIQDVRPLSRLKKLRKLILRNNSLIDLENAHFDSLADIRLQQLDLSYNVLIAQNGDRIWLTNVDSLQNLSTLKELILSENQISDISALSSLVDLKTLTASTNKIQDVSALQRLKYLKTIDLGNNDVMDLEPLSSLSKLEYLDLQSNRNIKTILPLKKLMSLKTLILDNVPVGDGGSVLSDKYHLKELSLINSQVTDITFIKDLKRLSTLNLQDNHITDISPLSTLVELKELNLQSNTQIQSIKALENLKKLKKLDLQNVPVGEEITFLENHNQLEFLDVRNSGITDITVLGSLMAAGALQDHPETGISASVDLRDNPLVVTDTEPYHRVENYWKNIGERTPFLLPENASLVVPAFSNPGGYYDQPFELTLTSDVKDAAIYYTLDGSEPTRESLLYSSPLKIQSRSGEPNTISEIQDVSPTWIKPNGEVAKATIIRARVISLNDQRSPIVTSTYLVGLKNRYTLPVVSLVTNPAYLFDKKFGIYVKGEIYDLNYDPASSINPWEWPANYNQKGQAWERPIHIEYFDVNGTLAFSQNVNTRIHGAATRERAEKTLRIYAACETDCKQTVDYELFPGLTNRDTGQKIQEFKSFLLRNSGNDWEQTLFRDAFIQSLMDHTRLDTQAYQPAIVFLNGEYWGIHNFRERLDEFYIENHYGINPDEIAILNNEGLIVSGLESDQQHYLDMLEFIRTHDMSNSENYEYVKTLMDVDNFIDYQILEIFSDNTNWPYVNVKYWRKKTTAYEPNAPYGQDGRWRWMIYDTDFGFGLDNVKQSVMNNNLTNAINPNWNEWAGFLFKSLLQNPEFKTSFINRFSNQLNTSFLPKRVVARVDQMQAVIEPDMPEHIARWRGDGASLQQWKDQVDNLRYFAENRPQYIREQLENYFGMTGTSAIHLEVDPNMGYVRVNSLDILKDTPGIEYPGSWTGVYFKGIPVNITAVPYLGYRFDHWEAVKNNPGENLELHLTLTEDISLKAVFVKE